MIHDFEIHARLRADVLECHAPPDAQTVAEGVDLTREEQTGAGRRHVAGRYEGVAIELSVFGVTTPPELDVAQPTRRSRKRPNSRPRKVARPE